VFFCGLEGMRTEAGGLLTNEMSRRRQAVPRQSRADERQRTILSCPPLKNIPKRGVFLWAEG